MDLESEVEAALYYAHHCLHSKRARDQEVILFSLAVLHARIRDGDPYVTNLKAYITLNEAIDSLTELLIQLKLKRLFQ